MNGRGSRRKGSAAELEVARIFTEHGIPATRNHDGSAGQPTGDLDFEPPHDKWLYVEVRRRERLDIPGWMREVMAKKGDRLGLLIYRQSHQVWRLILPPMRESIFLTDFLTGLEQHRG